jgi:hypothetical protein
MYDWTLEGPYSRMSFGPFIHCIHEFLKYENALKSDFKFEKSASNNSVFENLISTLKN